MTKLSALIGAAMALYCHFTAAKSLLRPVPISDSGSSAGSPSTTSSNRNRPTASPVPAPVLQTDNFDDIAANMSSFTLQNMISFFTGTKDIVNSNFTLFVGNHQKNGTGDENSNGQAKVIATEAFTEAIEKARCTDSSVMITFADKVRYREAQKEWKWINDQGEHHVYLVTKNQECDRSADDPDDVQLWDITEARFNNVAKSVTMMGQPVEFVDAFKDWSLKASNTGIFGVAGHGSGKKVQGRGIDTQGQISFDYQIDPKFGFAFGSSPLRPLVPTDPDSMMVGAIFCETCSIYGTFDWDLDIGTGSMSDLNPLEGIISLTARGVGATIQPKLELYDETEVIDHEMEIWGKAIPRSGIYKHKLFDIGATVHLIFRIKLDKTQDPMAAMVGFNISLADEAVFKIDLANPENSVVTGWNPSIDSLEPRISSNVSTSAIIGPRLMLSYGAEVVGQGAQVGIIFGGGNLEFNVTTDDQNSCSGNFSSRDVALEGGMINEVAAFGEAKLAKKVAATTTLASTSMQLFSTCQTVDAGLLGTPTRPIQLNEQFTPEIVAKVQSMKDKVTDGVKSVAATVTAEVESVASEASTAVTSVASAAKETVSSAAAEVQSEVKGVVAEATSAVAKAADHVKCLGGLFC